MRICDPACGTAGFLISAYNHILRRHTKPADLARGIVDGSLLKPRQWKFLEEHAFTGFDNDANMVKIAILNLYLHQLERARIEHHNPLTTTQGGQYPVRSTTCILANPPFAGRVQKESILADINLDTRDTELLFLKWFLDHLTDNGRAGVIVPNGVLFGSGKADRKLRELLLTTCDLQAVIALPSGVFKPYSGVGTAIFIFQKGHPTESVWFYELTADGFSLDDKRTPIEANDIPDILAKWPNREEGPNSFRVPVERIRENGWQLMPGRYKPVRLDLVEYDAPADILADVIRMEAEIAERAKALLKRSDRYEQLAHKRAGGGCRCNPWRLIRQVRGRGFGRHRLHADPSCRKHRRGSRHSGRSPLGARPQSGLRAAHEAWGRCDMHVFRKCKNRREECITRIRLARIRWRVLRDHSIPRYSSPLWCPLATRSSLPVVAEFAGAGCEHPESAEGRTRTTGTSCSVPHRAGADRPDSGRGGSTVPPPRRDGRANCSEIEAALFQSFSVPLLRIYSVGKPCRWESYLTGTAAG